VPDFKTVVVANREAKRDRLPVVTAPRAAADLLQQAILDESLRQGYASSGDTDIDAAKAVTVAPILSAAPPPQPPSPKVATHPQPQKSYALLSDAQIAGIKARLKLSSSQEYYWPEVEQALHALARKIHAARQVNPNANAGSLDPDSAEVQRLKSAAMPLLLQLREDQKDEVRKLARIIGLEKVAAAI
jgi:ABC-type transporter Mla MlaB component